jgi:hypothetical protein
MLEDYAEASAAPVLTGTTVTSVRAAGRGYVVRTDQGTWRAPTVVLACGARGAGAGVAGAGRDRPGRDRRRVAQFSGSLPNVCALADVKLGRLLTTIDAWAGALVSGSPRRSRAPRRWAWTCGPGRSPRS